MEQKDKNISLKRFEDGTPSIMRKPTVYTELHFYRKSDVLVQLTKAFCSRFFHATATAPLTRWCRRHVPSSKISQKASLTDRHHSKQR